MMHNNPPQPPNNQLQNNNIHPQQPQHILNASAIKQQRIKHL